MITQTALDNAKLFKVTGVDRQNRRFSITTSNYIYFLGINVWRGSKWVQVSGKWKLYGRYYN